MIHFHNVHLLKNECRIEDLLDNAMMKNITLAVDSGLMKMVIGLRQEHQIEKSKALYENMPL